MQWHPWIKQTLLNSRDGYFLVKRGLAKGLYIEEDFEHGLRTCFGLYERELIPYLRSLISVGDCCYDIGASNGYYTFMCGKLSKGRVYAFETEPDRIQALEKTLQYNRLDATKYSFTQAFIDKETNTAERKLALDDFVSQGHPAPNFVKMDIEGAEYNALLGLRRTLSENRLKMAIETHGKDIEAQCIEFLESLNYKVTIIDKAKYFQETRPVFHNRWLVVEPGRSV